MYLKITKQHKLFVLFCVQYIFVFRGINISCVFVFPFSGQFSRIYIVLHLFMIIQTSTLKRLKPFIYMNTFFLFFRIVKHIYILHCLSNCAFISFILYILLFIFLKNLYVMLYMAEKIGLLKIYIRLVIIRACVVYANTIYNTKPILWP